MRREANAACGRIVPIAADPSSYRRPRSCPALLLSLERRHAQKDAQQPILACQAGSHQASPRVR